MMQYKEPDMTVLEFANDDIVTTSGGLTGEDLGGKDGENFPSQWET